MTAQRKIFALLLITLLICILCVAFLDEPIAREMAQAFRHWRVSRLRLGTPYLLAPIAALGLWQGLRRSQRGTKLAEAMVIAAYSALAGVALNDLVLKRFFGRSSVSDFLQRDISHFHFLHGTVASSFPSGHAVVVSAIVTTLWTFYPRFYPVYMAAGLGVALLLMAGKWHFLSDIIVGLGLGAVAAQTTLLLWRSTREPSPL